MGEKEPANPASPPLGSIEPHAGLLKRPADGQLLYKVMTVENLLRSISGAYLHFNRVDSYKDFPGADDRDGRQLPNDQPGNAATRFAGAPDFSAAAYYDQSRNRTYACCFSLEESESLWTNYASGSEKGKIGIVFEFGKLRAALNMTLQTGNSALEYNGVRCHQIFSINYGMVEYVNWDTHRANEERLPNPIIYSYLKDKSLHEERELRISLSAPGIGQFMLNDGTRVNFPVSLQMPFDFRAALADRTIKEILRGPDCDVAFLVAELNKMQIAPSPQSTALSI
jgi:hypothetical protein